MSEIINHDDDVIMATVRLPRGLRREVKMWAAAHNTTIQHEVAEALRERMERAKQAQNVH